MRLKLFPKGYSWRIVLNRDRPSVAGRSDGLKTVSEIRSGLLALEGDCYDPATGRVDYRKLRASEGWKDVSRLTGKLRTFDPGILAGPDERKAFWVNLYNALVIDAVVELGVRETIWEVPMPFSRIAYEVGGRSFTADEIEHGILRCNARPPYPLAGPRFGAGAPELELIAFPFDPRIHFALVCGAKGCPPVRFYDPRRLDSQLDMAAKAFINGETRIDRTIKRVTTSAIFKYYSGDFGGLSAGLANYLAGYLNDPAEAEWLRGHAYSVKFSFSRYDWSLNL